MTWSPPPAMPLSLAEVETSAPQPRTTRRTRLVRLVGTPAEPRAEALEAPGPGVAIAGERRASRARRLLPALDLFTAGILAVVILGDWHIGLAYAVLAVPVVGVIESYYGAPLGGGARLRSVLRLTLAAIVCGWLAFLLVASFDRMVTPEAMQGLWLATVAAWTGNRLWVKRRDVRRPERVIVLGSGDVARRVVDLAERHAGGRLDVVGFLDDNPCPDTDRDGVPPYLGGQQQLKTLVAARRVDRVMVAFSQQPDTEMLDVLRACDEFGIHVDVIPRLFELLGTETRSYALGGMPVMMVQPRGDRRVQKLAKRAIDVIIAGGALVAAAPLLAIVALAIKLEDRGPVLYRQKRVGYRGRAFSIVKFRSMVMNADKLDAEIRNKVAAGGLTIEEAVASIKRDRDPRITRVGDFIRKTSLDELPQLWNVVKGDMSIVGPRPLRAFEVEALGGWELTRQLERPGITGLWQVTGRSDVNWHERMHLDYTYVRHWSLARDLEILARTPAAVFKAEGAR